jgi:hypothetical protein
MILGNLGFLSKVNKIVSDETLRRLRGKHDKVATYRKINSHKTREKQVNNVKFGEVKEKP